MRRRRRLAPFSLIIIIIIRYSLFLILYLTTIFFFLSFGYLTRAASHYLYNAIGAEDFSSARLECYFPLASFFFFSPRVCVVEAASTVEQENIGHRWRRPKAGRKSIDDPSMCCTLYRTTAVVSDDVARASPPPFQSQHMHSPHADIARTAAAAMPSDDARRRLSNSSDLHILICFPSRLPNPRRQEADESGRRRKIS